jgi:hypothetical protein
MRIATSILLMLLSGILSALALTIPYSCHQDSESDDCALEIDSLITEGVPQAIFWRDPETSIPKASREACHWKACPRKTSRENFNDVSNDACPWKATCLASPRQITFRGLLRPG